MEAAKRRENACTSLHTEPIAAIRARLPAGQQRLVGQNNAHTIAGIQGLLQILVIPYAVRAGSAQSDSLSDAGIVSAI